MEIQSRVEDGVLIVAIDGRLDAATAPVAETEINKFLEGDQNRLLFDLSKLEYLSSGGLRVILGAMKMQTAYTGLSRFLMSAVSLQCSPLKTVLKKV